MGSWASRWPRDGPVEPQEPESRQGGRCCSWADSKDEEDPKIQLRAKRKTGCYKVITADKNDDIVDFQASLIVGVAREICAQE